MSFDLNNHLRREGSKNTYLNSGKFSIKFMGPVIIFVIIFPKFLAYSSLKNYGKTHGKFPRIP